MSGRERVGNCQNPQPEEGYSAQVNRPRTHMDTEVHSPTSRSAPSLKASWCCSPELSILTVVADFITMLRCTCLRVFPSEKTRNSIWEHLH